MWGGQVVTGDGARVFGAATMFSLQIHALTGEQSPMTAGGSKACQLQHAGDDNPSLCAGDAGE